MDRTTTIAGVLFNDTTQEISFGKLDYIKDIFISDTTISKFEYASLIKYEYKEGENTISVGGSGVGRAIVGGVLFGGAGAIVGAATKKNNKKSVIADMSVFITFDIDGKICVKKVKINEFLDNELKYGSMSYMKYYNQAQNLMKKLESIYLSYHQEPETQKIDSNDSMVMLNADELRKYKGLLDDGIITESEFQLIKNRMLNVVRGGGKEESNKEEQMSLQEILELDIFNTLSYFFCDSEEREKALELLERYIFYKESIPNEQYADVMQKVALMTDKKGNTMLSEAVDNVYQNVVKELLDWGADITIEVEDDDVRTTILDLAIFSYWSDLEDDDAKQILDMIKNSSSKRMFDWILGDTYRAFSTYETIGEFFQEIIQSFSENFESDLYIEFSSNLNEGNSKKYIKARDNFLIPNNEKVFFIYDATLFHSVKKGFAICETGLYYAEKVAKKISWEEFQCYSLRDIKRFLNKFVISDKYESDFEDILKCIYVSLYIGELQLNKKERSEEYMYCAFCGKRILKGTRFCNYCGERVREAN